MSVRFCTLMNTWNQDFDVFEDVTQAYGVKVSVFLGYACVTNFGQIYNLVVTQVDAQPFE